MSIKAISMNCFVEISYVQINNFLISNEIATSNFGLRKLWMKVAKCFVSYVKNVTRSVIYITMCVCLTCQSRWAGWSGTYHWGQARWAPGVGWTRRAAAVSGCCWSPQSAAPVASWYPPGYRECLLNKYDTWFPLILIIFVVCLWPLLEPNTEKERKNILKWCEMCESLWRWAIGLKMILNSLRNDDL